MNKMQNSYPFCLVGNFINHTFDIAKAFSRSVHKLNLYIMKTTRANKKVNLFDKELYFYNEELYKAAKMAIKMGYKVHTFNPSGMYIKQIFVDNGKTFGSISENYSGVSYATCHKSERGSGNGTGFGLSAAPMNAHKELINKCFIFAPSWAKNTNGIKKETWEEHISRPINQILKYEEIKELN